MAFELVKIVELERAGIRDGNGHWENDANVSRVIGSNTELFPSSKHEF